MRRLTLAEIAAAIGAAPADPVSGSLTIDRVSIDSRDVGPGDLFWAIEGSRYDGHEFVGRALDCGAAAAVVRSEFAAVPVARPLLRVADTRAALGRLAEWYRRSCAVALTAVTGSVGKTSAREAISAVLSGAGATVRSQKNYNNDIGVPLSLLEIGPEHRFAVIELGASGPGEIARLAEIAAPDIGVLTAIGEAHLEGFGSLDGVAQAKGELVRYLERRGVAVLNWDDDRVRTIGLAARCGVLWYGTLPCPYGLFARARDIQTHGETVSFCMNRSDRVFVRAPGRHQVYAVLAAIAAARWLGMSDAAIRHALQAYRPAAMRCQVERWNGVVLVNDAYNANPTSMWAAVTMLESWPATGRRVLVCGDMVELGPSASEYHRRLGEAIALRGRIDYCVALGDLAAGVIAAARQAGMPDDRAVHCETVEQAAGLLLQTVRRGDVVVFKASRAMQLERLVAAVAPRIAA